MNEELKEDGLEQRMYCLTLYNISPIQQGIQSAHAIVEYAQVFSKTEEYQRWAQVDKTIIILNGGSSVTLKEHIDYLINNCLVSLSFFKEPDLFGGITAVCFLADERIWNHEKYPDRAEQPKYKNGYVEYIYYHFDEKAFIEQIGGEKNYQLKLFLEEFRKA
jgi:hypothetical protein